MGHAQINVRTRACSRTFTVRCKQAALTLNIRGKESRDCLLLCLGGWLFVCIRSSLHSVRFRQLLHCAHRRIVNNESNNMQVELI